MSSNLAISLVIGASVGAAVSGINQIKSTIKALGDSTQSVSQRLDNLSKLSVAGMKSSAASLTALGGSIIGLAKPAIEFESAMADVLKVVDFKTPEGFKNLSKDLLDLTDTIPMTAKELASIAASGGQLGVAEGDIKAFTQTIAKMSVAFDMSAEQSGDAMAKLANVYKIPISEIGKLGDAINELSNNSPAKASDIVNTLSRIGGTAKQFGLTENAATALSNTFISLGKSPEVAGTAINGMLTKLMTAEKGGKAFQGALKQVGISAKQLKNNIAKDGQAALTDFLKRLEKLPKDKAMGVLVDLFGREYADDVAVLAGNVDLLDKSLNALQETDENGQLKYLGSMEKEFAARSATTEASLERLKNSVVKLGISIGTYVLPVINKFVSWLQPIIIRIAEWVNTNSELMESIAQWGTYIVAGIGGFSALTGVLSVVTFFGLKAFSTLGMVWKVISFGGSIIGSVVSFALPLIMKLALGFGYLIGYTIKFAAALSGALVKGLMLAGKAVLFLGRALLMNPIGLAVTAIGVAAFVIYKYWEPIKAFFGNLWSWVSTKFSEAGQWISNAWMGVSNWFSSIWQTISTGFSTGITNIGNFITNFNPLALFQSVFSTVLGWFGIELPNSFSGFGKNIIDGLVNGIKNAWELAKNTVSELGSGIKNWFAEKLGIHSPSRVFMGFGENTVQGLAIGIAQNAMLATTAVGKVGEDMQTAMPKSVASPVVEMVTAGVDFAKQAVETIKPTVSVASPIVELSNISVELAKNTIEKAKPVVATAATESVKNVTAKRKKKSPAISTVQKSVVSDIAKPIEPLQPVIEQKSFWGNLWDSVSDGFSEFGKSLDFGFDMLKNGTDIDFGSVFNPSNQDWQTPSFNPNSGQYTDYQPLNRNAVAQNETNNANNNGGIVVHFSPTINVNGSGEQTVGDQLQQGLQMGMYEFEQLLNRVLDQRQRRAY